MSSPPEQDDRRSFIRFEADKNSLLSLSPEKGSEVEELVGLLRDVSKKGCAGVFHEPHFDYSAGDKVYVSSKEHESLEATIVWVKKLDKQFVKTGFEFNSVIGDVN